MGDSSSRGLRKGTLFAGEFEIPYATTESQLSAASPTAPILICVNGMQQTMAMWRSVLKRMSATGYRTVLFDFPNQGRAAELNQHLGGSSLSVEQQVEVLHAVVEHVAPEQQVALIGGSWGALVAAAFASAHPT